MRQGASLIALALVTSAAAHPLLGQDDDFDVNDQYAYDAISTTPLGALPPTIASALAPTQPRGVGVRALVGYLDEEGPFSRRAYALALDLPVGRSTLAVTGGLVDFACDVDQLRDDLGVTPEQFNLQCRSGFMGGASWAAPLAVVSFGASRQITFGVGLEATVGVASYDSYDSQFGSPTVAAAEQSGSSLSAGFGLPLALSVKGDRVALIPHLTPRMAFGRSTAKIDGTAGGVEDDKLTESGSRFMLGTGLAMVFGSRFGVDVGFQHVFYKESKTVIGIGVRAGLR